MPEKGSSEPTHTKSHLVYKSDKPSAYDERIVVRTNLLFWKIDCVLISVSFNIQLVITNSNDCPVEISHERFPLRPLVRFPVGVFPVPKRIQGTQGPREQRNVREVVTLVELFS